MATCTNDLTPIIVVVAAQIPILVAALVGWLKYQQDATHSRARQYSQIKKLDDLTLITTNGFHGPAGPAGPTGPTGPAGPAGQSGYYDLPGQKGPAGPASQEINQ